MSESPGSKKFDEQLPDAKKQAQDFVDFLHQRYVRNREKKDQNLPQF